MSEIEKMYENAGVERKKPACIECFLDWYSCNRTYDECPELYPPFTAEKQLELIKLLSSIKDFEFESVFARGLFIIGCRECVSNNKHWAENEKFEEALAELINALWQTLTAEECKQIKEILE